MFGRRILGGSPDSFKLVLGLHTGAVLSPQGPAPKDAFDAALDRADSTEVASTSELPDEGDLSLETSTVEWTSDDPDAVVVSKLKNAATRTSGVLEERVKLVFSVTHNPGGMVTAATFQKDVEAALVVEKLPPQLRRLHFSRVTPSGSVGQALLSMLMHACSLEGLAELACAEGLVPIWDGNVAGRLETLRTLSIAHCSLSTLPGAVCNMTTLRELDLSGNKLTALPRDLGKLVKLRRLLADNNLITSVPVELRSCSELRDISLESNRLAMPVMDLRSLSHLHSLQLWGNPLEFVPELSPCTALRRLSLVNVRMVSSPDFSACAVEVGNITSYMQRGSKLAALFGLIFRRASCQHPLLAGALGKIAEDPANCAVIAREVGAIQQLILMALSENEVVVEQACKTIGLLGRHNSLTSQEIIASNVMSAMISLIASLRHKRQLAGLHVIMGLALSSEAAARKLLSAEVLGSLQELIRSGAHDVQAAALETIGNLAFCRPNRAIFLHAPHLRERLAQLALGTVGAATAHVRSAAIRALAIMGENEEVTRATKRPRIDKRGVRILSMDGGGMKGLSTVRLLQQLEERTGRRIHELFDLVAGTSTGGILAVATALKHFTLAECQEIYRRLGQKVFSKAAVEAKSQKVDETWRESLYRVYKSGQQNMRVAVYGAKHDAAMFETLLRDICTFNDDPASTGNAMVDTAVLGTPKCFVVATLASMTPAMPFVFRNYEHPLSSSALATRLGALPGSSSHEVWQAVRASSAAPYYLDDFKCGGQRFQDGAATANNPAAIAIQEARLLWPDTPIECVVSLGSGALPPTPRERSMSSYLDTGSVLIESACETEQTDSVLATLLSMVPGVQYYRFNCIDTRCGMDLDEIDPAQWAILDAATDDYIVREDGRLDALCRLLIHNLANDRPHDISSMRLGAARGLMVVEAPRGLQSLDAFCTPSHVETVASSLAALPMCEAHCRIDAMQLAAHSSGRMTAEADLSMDGGGSATLSDPAAEVLGAALREGRGSVGVVHLALHGTAAGPICAWHHELLAVAEPSQQAEALLRDCGLDPAESSLRQHMAESPTCSLSGEWLEFLSEQSQIVEGQRLSTFLLRRTRPSAFLTPAMAEAVLGGWQDVVITTSAILPRPLLRALLSAGCKAVICREASPQELDPDLAAAFFCTLCKELVSGRPVVTALEHAGAETPSLAGDFRCLYLQNGELTAARIQLPAAAGEDSDAAMQ